MNGIEIQLISAFTVPMICEPLVRPIIQVAVQCREHLDGLQLADSCADDSFQPDILIGIDYDWSFVTGEYIHIPSGPVAMNTLLGWIVSGPMLGPSEEDPARNAQFMNNLPTFLSFKKGDTRFSFHERTRSLYCPTTISCV